MLSPERERFGIEVVDLKGEIAPGKANTALKLRALLDEDRRIKRFSYISFDCDVPANVKAIGNVCRDDLVVGLVSANTPDFEFANFTLDELREIAAGIADPCGRGGVGQLIPGQ